MLNLVYATLFFLGWYAVAGNLGIMIAWTALALLTTLADRR
jgi:hypothetical protein